MGTNSGAMPMMPNMSAKAQAIMNHMVELTSRLPSSMRPAEMTSDILGSTTEPSAVMTASGILEIFSA